MRILRIRSGLMRLAVTFATQPSSKCSRTLAMSSLRLSTGTPTASMLQSGECTKCKMTSRSWIIKSRTTPMSVARSDEARMREIFFKRTEDGIKTFHVTDLQDHAAARRQISEFGGVRSVVGDRLLDQHMFAFRKQSAPDGVVRVGGRRHRRRINHSNEFIQRLGCSRAELRRDRAIGNRIHIIYGGQLSRRNLCI